MNRVETSLVFMRKRVRGYCFCVFAFRVRTWACLRSLATGRASSRQHLHDRHVGFLCSCHPHSLRIDLLWLNFAFSVSVQEL